MDVANLGIDGQVIDHLREAGIQELYPPQRRAVKAGLLEGENVLAAVPTAGGKTLLAQLAAVSADGPAVYVVPLRALATEKAATFDALPGVEVGVATGDYATPDEGLEGKDVIVATGEKVDAALRRGADWIADVACVVVDEIHLIDDEQRGPTVEMTITALRERIDDLQVVGLSATVGNAAAMADWLDATLVDDDWRPVDLRAGVYDGRRMRFADGSGRELRAGQASPTTALVLDAVARGGGCLVFVNSRRSARDLARELADGRFGEASDLADEIEYEATTRAGEALADCVRHGVAFHHAGLRAEHRHAVEEGFRDRRLSAICATPTLAAGVNVPARRVVVRDHRRYGDDGPEDLSTLEVKQMFGRAGRPGLDPHGEALLVASGNAEDLLERYVRADPEPVTSELAGRRAIRTHVLAAVVGGIDDREALQERLGATFHAHTEGVEATREAAADAVIYLRGAGMIAEGEGLAATELGDLVSTVYVDPMTGADVVERLADPPVAEVTPLTALEVIADTPELRSLYVREGEAGRLSEVAMRREDELARSVTDFDGEFGAWLATLKTARVLESWVEGASADDLTDQYGIGPGDVRRLADRAEWLAGATASIAAHVDSDLTPTIRTVRERLEGRSL